MALDDTILLVEDDPAAVQIAKHAFKKSGVATERITVAVDGEQALAWLFETSSSSIQPRLILLDLKLPKVDGLEVLKRIRQEKRTQDIPVIILTNSDEERDVVRGYDLGANSYLKKPIDFQALIDLLKQLGFVNN
ncbi:response regulator [Magnetococcales bacterium HHB-1]